MKKVPIIKINTEEVIKFYKENRIKDIDRTFEAGDYVKVSNHKDENFVGACYSSSPEIIEKYFGLSAARRYERSPTMKEGIYKIVLAFNDSANFFYTKKIYIVENAKKQLYIISNEFGEMSPYRGNIKW